MSVRSEVVAVLLGVTGLSGKVFNDAAPKGTEKPYVTLDWEVSVVPEVKGDGGVLWSTNTLTGNLWMSAGLDDGTLRQSMSNAINSYKMLAGRRLALSSSLRVDDDEFQTIHYSLTISCLVPG